MRSPPHQRIPLKYRRDVPSIITIASSPWSAISLEARPCRASRSSRVIGLASLFRDLRRSIEGGRGVPLPPSARAGLAKEFEIAAPPASRNRRREIIDPPQVGDVMRDYTAERKGRVTALFLRLQLC